MTTHKKWTLNDARGCPLVVSYGGGTNSTAMLIGMAERGERPDLILFADTGAERPEIYAYIEHFSRWLTERGFPRVITVKRHTTHGQHGRYETLEENCLVNGVLPSISYGFKGCSMKFKGDVLDKFVNKWPPAIKAKRQDAPIYRAIGFDISEIRRKRKRSSGYWRFLYPLDEWMTDRPGCERLILDAGLCLPGKSACFFCGAAKKREVIELSKTHPDLFDRAVAIERRAIESGSLTTVKGLGRHWSWEELVASDQKQQMLFSEPADLPCECWD